MTIQIKTSNSGQIENIELSPSVDIFILQKPLTQKQLKDKQTIEKKLKMMRARKKRIANKKKVQEVTQFLFSISIFLLQPKI